MKTVPIGEALAGLEIKPPDNGDTPIEAVVLAKYINSEGKDGWFLRYTPGITTVEMVGALEVIRHHEMVAFERDWREDDDE